MSEDKLKPMYDALNKRTGTGKLNPFFNSGFKAGWKAALEYARGQQEPVGEVGTMPGTTGFTMACFKSSDVPIGSKLYIHPAPKSYAEQCQAEGWLAVRKTLDELMPGWANKAKSGMEAACTAIRELAQPVQPAGWQEPVQPDDLRQAALIDLAYINGAKAGWNMCVADDESQFQKLMEGVAECVNVLKNTRSQATAQPVQPDYEEVLADHRRLIRELDVLINGEEGASSQASLCDIVSQVKRMGLSAQPVQPAVNEQLLEALKLLVNCMNLAGWENDWANEKAKAAIAAAEAAKGGV